MSSFVNSGFKCFFLRQGEKREREEKRERCLRECEAASEERGARSEAAGGRSRLLEAVWVALGNQGPVLLNHLDLAT